MRVKGLTDDRLADVLRDLSDDGTWEEVEAQLALFGVDKATVSRNGRRILAVLRRVGEGEIEWPDLPAQGEGKGLAEAPASYPDLFAILDGTEQPVQRPRDPQRQRAFYSGKKKRHMIKKGLVVSLLRSLRFDTSRRRSATPERKT